MTKSKTAILIEGFEEDPRSRGMKPIYKKVNVIDTHEKIIFSQEFDLKPKDRVYFLQGCTVPRFKIRDYIKSRGASICKYMKDATIVVAGEPTLEILSSKASIFAPTRQYFKNWVDKNYVKGSYLTYQLLTDIDECESDRVYIQWNLLNKMQNSWGNKNFTVAFDSNPEEWRQKVNAKQHEDDEYDFRTDPESPVWLHTGIYIFGVDPVGVTITSGEVNPVDEQALLKVINTDNITMDHEMYQELRTMLNSPDQTNIPLAMEIMANCDYEKSFLYLCLLLKEHAPKMVHRKEVNHVNFKALLKFLGINGLYHSFTMDEIVSLMMKKKLLTPSKLEAMMPIIENEIRGEFACKNFTVQIIPNDQLKANLQPDTQEESIPALSQVMTEIFNT